MDPDLEQRVAAAAARGRAALHAGATVDEVLRVFRQEDQLGMIGVILALRAIEPIGLAAARQIVEPAWMGTRFPHLGLEQLRHLAHLPHRANIHRWLPSHLQSAIIDGHAWTLFVPGGPRSVRFYNSATADPARAASMSGDGVSFEWVRDEAIAAVAEPGWCDEVRVARDEPGLLLVHFPRVREAAPTS